MSARLITLPQGEGGEEVRTTFVARHNCPNAKLLKQHLPPEEVNDEVLFSVGLFGQGMPAYTPFIVESTTPCDCCGTYLKCWFQWSAPKIWLPT